MDAKTQLKARLPSRHATEGAQRAPHRAFYDAMGLTMANECGIKFELFDVADVLKRTPCIADLKPSGRYVAKDMLEAGGVPLLMQMLPDHGYIAGECLTVAGRSAIGLKGNLAPECAIVKVAGMERLQFSGAARCFDAEESCFEAVKNKKYREGDALVRDGDTIELNAETGTLNVKLAASEPDRRAKQWKPRPEWFTSGYLWKYARQVGAARSGAVTHPDAAVEMMCYADI